MPLLLKAEERLHHGVEILKKKHCHLPFDKIESLLLADLQQQLLGILFPTMVLELNVARLRGLLSGDTSKERFISFIERLQNQDVAIALLQEYPVLAQQIVICIERWITVVLEFLHRLCSDWQAICTAFSPEQYPGVLVLVKWSAGDSHCGGRNVCIAKFSSGFQVVYKSLPLAVDVHFQELLTYSPGTTVA